MSIHTTNDQTKTNTPRRLPFKRDIEPADPSTITILFGTRELTGVPIEEKFESSNFVSVGEVAGQKRIRRTVFDANQVTSILTGCINAVDNHRTSLGYEVPVRAERTSWPTSIPINDMNFLSQTARYTGIPPNHETSTALAPETLLTYDQRQFPREFAFFFFSYAGWFYREFARLWDTGPRRQNPTFAGVSSNIYALDLDPSSYYVKVFGTLLSNAAITFEEAVAITQNYYDNVGGSTNAIALFHGAVFSALKRLETFMQSLLRVAATFEMAYFNLTQLPGTEEINAILKNWLTLLYNKRQLLIRNGMYRLVLAGRYLRDSSTFAANARTGSRNPYWILGDLIADRLGNKTDVLGDQLRALHLLEWEQDGFLPKLQELGVSINDSQMRENYYSGAIAFSQGTLDRLYTLSFNGLTLPQFFENGNNDCYYPLLFGGFDGEGGIGSTLNRQIQLHSGTNDQVATDVADDSQRTIEVDGVDYPANYNLIAHMAFDKFNFGGRKTLPSLSALATRILIQANGEPQWYVRYATITTLVPANLRDDHVIDIISSDDAKGVVLLRYLQRILTQRQQVRYAGRLMSVSDLSQQDFYAADWKDNLPALGELPDSADLAVLEIGSTDNESAIHVSDVDITISTWLQDNVDSEARFSKENLNSIYTMNPVHALREVLTNNDWDYGVPSANIDTTSFEGAARRCYTERLGCAFNMGNTSAEQAFKLLRDYINCDVYYDADLDAVVIKLIRDDYNEASLPSMTETNVSSFSGYQRNYNAKAVSRLTIQYKTADGVDETVALTAPNFLMQTAAQTVNYPCCPDERTALKVANRELAIANDSPLTFTITVDIQTAASILIGAVIRVTWPAQGLNETLMRVVNKSIAPSDVVNIKLLQEQFIPLAKDLV